MIHNEEKKTIKTDKVIIEVVERALKPIINMLCVQEDRGRTEHVNQRYGR